MVDYSKWDELEVSDDELPDPANVDPVIAQQWLNKHAELSERRDRAEDDVDSDEEEEGSEEGDEREVVPAEEEPAATRLALDGKDALLPTEMDLQWVSDGEQETTLMMVGGGPRNLAAVLLKLRRVSGKLASTDVSQIVEELRLLPVPPQYALTTTNMYLWSLLAERFTEEETQRLRAHPDAARAQSWLILVYLHCAVAPADWPRRELGRKRAHETAAAVARGLFPALLKQLVEPVLEEAAGSLLWCPFDDVDDAGVTQMAAWLVNEPLMAPYRLTPEARKVAERTLVRLYNDAALPEDLLALARKLPFPIGPTATLRNLLDLPQSTEWKQPPAASSTEERLRWAGFVRQGDLPKARLLLDALLLASARNPAPRRLSLVENVLTPTLATMAMLQGGGDEKAQREAAVETRAGQSDGGLARNFHSALLGFTAGLRCVALLLHQGAFLPQLELQTVDQLLTALPESARPLLLLDAPPQNLCTSVEAWLAMRREEDGTEAARLAGRPNHARALLGWASKLRATLTLALTALQLEERKQQDDDWAKAVVPVVPEGHVLFSLATSGNLLLLQLEVLQKGAEEKDEEELVRRRQASAACSKLASLAARKHKLVCCRFLCPRRLRAVSYAVSVPAARTLRVDSRNDDAPWLRLKATLAPGAPLVLLPHCGSCGKVASSEENNDDEEFSRCSRCHFAAYCSKKCQSKDWKAKHRAACPAIITAPPPKAAASTTATTNNDHDRGGGDESATAAWV